MEGLLLACTGKLPQLQALCVVNMTTSRHLLAIEVCDDGPRTDGACRLVEKEVHFLEEILDGLHGTAA